MIEPYIAMADDFISTPRFGYNEVDHCAQGNKSVDTRYIIHE